MIGMVAAGILGDCVVLFSIAVKRVSIKKKSTAYILLNFTEQLNIINFQIRLKSKPLIHSS